MDKEQTTTTKNDELTIIHVDRSGDGPLFNHLRKDITIMDNYAEIKDPKTTTELWELLDRVTDIVTECIYHGIATDGCYNNIDITMIARHLSSKLETLAELREVMARYFSEYDSVETEAPGEGSHRAGSCHN